MRTSRDRQSRNQTATWGRCELGLKSTFGASLPLCWSVGLLELEYCEEADLLDWAITLVFFQAQVSATSIGRELIHALIFVPLCQFFL